MGALSGVVEKAISRNGIFLGKRGGTVQITFEGNGLVLTPVAHDKYRGIYVKHDGQVFQGKGILFGKNSPFKDIPLLGLLL